MWSFRSRVVPLILAALLIWLFLWYSHDLVGRLEETRARANETIAWFWAGTQVPLSVFAEEVSLAVCSGCGAAVEVGEGIEGPVTLYCVECGGQRTWHVVSPEWTEERSRLLESTSHLFRELVERLDYTTILTDTMMVPQVVNGRAVPDGAAPEKLAMYGEMVKELDALNDPVPIEDVEDNVIGYLHYGSDNLARELRLVPFIELGVLALLALVFLFMVRGELRREKEMSWMGFAKETAHQISTPLSSLMGWVELLRERPTTGMDPELEEALDSIENDVKRLDQIASRYGQMGKEPVLETGSLNSVVLDTVHYLAGRPGYLPKGVELETDLQSQRSIRLNRVLMGWVVENLLKNSVAALSGGGGTIKLTTSDLEEGNGLVEMEVADTGRGIPFSDQKRIFRPGFTTRRGGWGLGLTLSRRIVEEYHRGSIRLKASSPGKGTVFVMTFPVAAEEGQ